MLYDAVGRQSSPTYMPTTFGSHRLFKHKDENDLLTIKLGSGSRLLRSSQDPGHARKAQIPRGRHSHFPFRAPCSISHSRFNPRQPLYGWLTDRDPCGQAQGNTVLSQGHGQGSGKFLHAGQQPGGRYCVSCRNLRSRASVRGMMQLFSYIPLLGIYKQLHLERTLAP